MKPTPPITILDSLFHPDGDQAGPLHVKLRRALQQVIQDYFENGQQFWTEQALTASLGVSQITIRRALGDLAKDGFLVRRKSRGSIVTKMDLEAASGYRVALFLPQYESDQLQYLLEQFVIACRAHGRRLDPIFVHQSMGANEVMQMLDHGPSEQRLVFLDLPTELSDSLSLLACDHAYRFVLVDTHMPLRVTDSVETDEAEGISLMLRHLAQLGHRRITLIVNEPEAARSVGIRRRSFEQLTRELGMTGRVVSCGTRFWESAYDAAYEAMPAVWGHSQDDRPTAIMTVSDVGAWAVLKWLTEQNVRVPHDVSVAGYNDERPSRFTSPTLTTVRINASAMCEATLRQLHLTKTERAEIRVHPHLIVRDSTAPPPPGRRKKGVRQHREDALIKA